MSIFMHVNYHASLVLLTNREQAQVNDTVQKFQRDQGHQSLRLEKLRISGASIWSVRANDELRVILQSKGPDWYILHVGHHDAAYDWAQRHKLEAHEKTSAMQLINTEYRSVEIEVPELLPCVFRSFDDEYLLSLGVPAEMLPMIRQVRTEDQLLKTYENLPELVGDRLIDLYEGRLVTPPTIPSTRANQNATFEARYTLVPLPEALEESEVLLKQLSQDFARWTVFLHPEQRKIVEGIYSGPVQVSGAPGTGKTIVALHRARLLVSRGSRVLIATYTRALADNLRRMLAQLCTPFELKQVEVSTLHSIAVRLSGIQGITRKEMQQVLKQAFSKTSNAVSWDLLWREWLGVIEARGVLSWESYRVQSRVGRGNGLTLVERRSIWTVVESAFRSLEETQKGTFAMCAKKAAEVLSRTSVMERPYDAVILDEFQDMSAAEIGFVAELGARNPGNVMVFGDSLQRIYASSVSATSRSLDVRGRQFELKTQYRTTEQIRRAAANALSIDPNLTKKSVLQGPEPQFVGYENEEEEIEAMFLCLQVWEELGIPYEEMSILVRERAQLDLIKDACMAREVSFQALHDNNNGVRLGTMHGAKGLEFRAVLLGMCSLGKVPSPALMSQMRDPQDQEDAIERERRLLYVAMTRARDELMVSWSGTRSSLLISSGAHPVNE